MLGSDGQGASWTSSQLLVYGRKLFVPRQFQGVSCWNFDQLAHSLGPADYISLASNYHTFIIDQVPALTLARKNEARRFITLLDALYEARCKLLLRADVGPDDLFFPDTKVPETTWPEATKHVRPGRGEDPTYSETVAEVYQDQTSPFRPNVSTYADDGAGSGRGPDQDSEFRGEGPRQVDFSNAVAFTGEDERFAYKRASSRLWELCGSRWHARTGDWWHPLPAGARHWEGTSAADPPPDRRAVQASSSDDLALGPSVELDEPGGLQKLKVAALKREALADGR